MSDHEQPPAREPGGPTVLGWGVTMTWWYTVGSLLFFQAALSVSWAVTPGLAVWSGTGWAWVVFAAGAAAWLGSTVTLLLAYRRSAYDGTRPWRGGAALPALGTLVAGVVLAGATAEPAVGITVVVQAATLLRWPTGVRKLVAVAATVAVALAWLFGGPGPVTELPAPDAVLFLSLGLPFVSASALWWWDIVEELDRTRAAEAGLAATQERLRLAGDLHDLQGHHFQVIALQLELAERLLERDPAAALEQVQAARASVDDARCGTRDLATQFRGVPLPDELANAADLLRAAGLDVTVEVDRDAGAAPADVLGPVVRETTTNVLKHGGRGWARLRLRRVGGAWTYGIGNDRREPAPEDAGETAGRGLPGIVDRVRAVGGTAQVDRRSDTFEVVVTVPSAAGGGER